MYSTSRIIHDVKMSIQQRITIRIDMIEIVGHKFLNRDEKVNVTI